MAEIEYENVTGDDIADSVDYNLAVRLEEALGGKPMLTCVVTLMTVIGRQLAKASAKENVDTEGDTAMLKLMNDLLRFSFETQLQLLREGYDQTH